MWRTKYMERDHPHACGDKFHKTFTKLSYRGSSPRVWGQAARNIKITDNVRIIPTRVGTSASLRVIKSTLWDHPHACGDKASKPLVLSMTSGSSPRVWGQASTASTATSPAGIIPTRVGTSVLSACPCLCRWDHPHACGDKRYVTLVKVGMLGSSPRVWGQVELIDELGTLEGIIPTRVGTRLA